MTRRKYSHALITGGAGGIGKAIAECFMRDRYRVTLVDCRCEALENIRRDWPSVEIATLDITDTTELRSLVDDLGRRNDGPDVIVNCAGIHHSTPLTSPGYPICEQLVDIDREIRTNVVALAQHCALWRPYLMARTNGAAIVNIASALAFVPKYSSAIYCATKAAVHQFSRVLALQLAETGIRVVTVYPPLVATAMTAGRNEGAMPSAEFAARFYRAFAKGETTIHVGESKWLYLIDRLSPSLALRLVES
jgi:uncharacterized oxidoreductase